jgi:hypothetical protein
VGVLFYLKPDGQYILADDDGMAVFLFIVIMLSVYNNQQKHSHDSVTNLHILSI